MSASSAALDQVVAKLKEKQAETGVTTCSGVPLAYLRTPDMLKGRRLLPMLRVYAYAAAQVKKAIEVTNELDGLGYTFWGGREGYSTLLNTNMKQ